MTKICEFPVVSKIQANQDICWQPDQPGGYFDALTTWLGDEVFPEDRYHYLAESLPSKLGRPVVVSVRRNLGSRQVDSVTVECGLQRYDNVHVTAVGDIRLVRIGTLRV